MAVTRSTPAERRQQQGQQGQQRPGVTRWVSKPPGTAAAAPRADRTRETVLLAASLVVALLGMFLIYRAASHDFGQVTADLQSGKILNLEQVTEPEKLQPFMPEMSGSGERAFAARKVWQRLSEKGRLPNVGELGRIRVGAAEIEDDSRLEELRERLEAAREGAAPSNAETESPTVRLFSSAELREIKPELVVRTPGEFRRTFWLWGGLLVAGFVLVHVVWRLRGFQGDQVMLPILLTLTGIGFLVMVSVRDPLRDMMLFRTFAQGVLMGCGLLLAASLVDWERSPLRRMTFVPLFGALGLSLLLILFGSGPGGSDAKVNLFGFQPVEVIKILFVLFLAGYFLDRWEFLRELPEKRAGLGGVPSWLRIPKLEYSLPPVLAIGAVLFFFFLQKDLGPALVLSFLFLLLYSVARGRPTMMAVGAVLVVAAFMVGYQLGYPRTVTGRIGMWLSPWDNAYRGGEHLAQGLWALAGGSLSGMGLGLGDPEYVPEIHTDMVLAAVGEELGFLGLLAVFALYALLVWRGLRAALRSPGVYGFFLALGLTLTLALPILLISGGVLGLVPLSGVVSPFLSFGRSALLANLFIAGMLLAVSARRFPGGGATEAAVVRRFEGSVRWIGLGLAAALVVILGR
ncbi:MAG TPA: FtsW/RodA/SpoVE family cell cycle protein, partial [Thermoanaerobaculia bacterium]|nr:FtsW/RodA/SpoVE family cell cycle protein [Thermoanaerobaculia bacterium]